MTPVTLGRSGIDVSPVCFGTSPLAGMAMLYGYDVGEQRAVETVAAMLTSSIRFIDTSNGYGANGEAEHRIGVALEQAGGLPADVVLATKVDPLWGSTDFSGDRVRRSLEESLERLGLDRVPLLHLHDPERIPFDEGVSAAGPMRALIDLKERGLVDAIGVAGGPIPLMQRYLDTGEFDVVLSHNRFTLLDRSATSLYESARERGVGVLNAAPYGGGILSRGPVAQPKYAYGMGARTAVDAAIAMQAVCDEHGVPLAAAALQFSMRSPLVDSTIVGVSAAARVAETERVATVEIPDELWPALEALVPDPSTWLGDA